MLGYISTFHKLIIKCGYPKDSLKLIPTEPWKSQKQNGFTLTAALWMCCTNARLGCHGPFRDKTFVFKAKTTGFSHGVDRDCQVSSQ